MEECSHHHQASSRLGPRNPGGEIVEVPGGHIVRSIGRKDRHSKVCTAKGPRDRRVRLAAHTAIQFYDVQDRLGYDRPSKAVDWLIKKAKAAIDELAQLPAWNPITTLATYATFEQDESQEKLKEDQKKLEEEQQHLELGVLQANLVIANTSGPSSKRAMTMLGSEDEQPSLHQRGNMNDPNAHSVSFLPPSLDSDSISDTIKSFFPMGASAQPSSSGMQFQNFPATNLIPRNNGQSQDLRLSLQSFQDPILLHHQSQRTQHHQNPCNHTEQAHSQAQVLLRGIPLGYDGSAGWPEHHMQQQAEFNRFQRFSGWNAGGDAAGVAATAAGYLFNSPPAPQPLLQQLLGQNQFFSQRGPLQSSNTPSIRAWMDPTAISIDTADHDQQQHHYPAVMPIYPSSMSGIGFATGVGGGFSGFHVPARIQGGEDEHDGYSDKLSSASSDSRH